MKHILVVEDEEHLAIGIKFNLEAEGYRVSVVMDGRSAVDFVEQHGDDIDLIILDLMLPSMSGYAVCESIRDAGHFMPVLILSARTLSEDRTRGFDAGADQYLTKPFELDELLSRTKRLLLRSEKDRQRRESERSELTEYRFGNAVINFETFEVWVDNKPARLTRLELRLLEYFIKNKDRVIPRAELLMQVWDMPPHIKTRAPDQIIRRLRKTFEPDPTQPRYFLTLRDAGYRFVDASP
jgi:two-component system OmpR family response regulator